jgi:hypothetical protein
LFKTRKIKRVFPVDKSLGYKNLIVSGCSFTHNVTEDHLDTWPYYLRDIGGFNEVYDCSLPGAGNNHIANSLQWCLETDPIDPADSLVIVMWSGVDRDDLICPKEHLTPYPEFKFTDTVSTGITGGLLGSGNTTTYLTDLAQQKTSASRSIENFLLINGIYHYLHAKKYQFLFLDFCKGSSIVSGRTKHFDITPYLPKNIQQTYKRMFTNLTDLHEWAIRHDFLQEDDLHCNIHGHLDWTRKVLHPYLVDNYSI